PVGHPVKIYSPEIYNSDWFGFVKCKVITPRRLYHPVLPVKINTGETEKLLFTLCKICPTHKQKDCDHDDEQRSLTGTWTTVDINKALGKGYKIEKIYEVHHFEKKSSELFKGYVRDFMKIKLETSPWNKDFNSIDEYVNT